MRIGIAGFGVAGRATADIVVENAGPIEPDWRDLIRSRDVDIVVEVMGGTDGSLQVVCAVLTEGKPIVTANKNSLAEHEEELFALA